jgi:hypothetical protein
LFALILHLSDTCAGFSKNMETTISGMTAQYWKGAVVGFENRLVKGYFGLRSISDKLYYTREFCCGGKTLLYVGRILNKCPFSAKENGTTAQNSHFLMAFLKTVFF